MTATADIAVSSAAPLCGRAMRDPDYLPKSGGPTAAPTQRTGFGSRLIGMGPIGRRRVRLFDDPEGLLVNFEAPVRSVREIRREEKPGAE